MTTRTRISWTDSGKGSQSVWSQVCRKHMHTASPFASHFQNFIASQESSTAKTNSSAQNARAGRTQEAEPMALDCTEWVDVDPSEAERLLGVTGSRCAVRTSIMSDGTIRNECVVLRDEA